MTHIRVTLAAGLLVFGAAAAASAQQSAPAQATHAQATHAQAQRVRGRHAKGKRGGMKRGGALLKGIALSAAEKANVKAVRAKYAPQLKALRTQPKSNERREQAKQLMLAARNEIRAGLAPANQAKFDANVARFEQRVAQRRGKRGGHRAPSGAPSN